jgi:hypothetical protein
MPRTPDARNRNFRVRKNGGRARAGHVISGKEVGAANSIIHPTLRISLCDLTWTWRRIRPDRLHNGFRKNEISPTNSIPSRHTGFACENFALRKSEMMHIRRHPDSA